MTKTFFGLLTLADLSTRSAGGPDLGSILTGKAPEERKSAGQSSTRHDRAIHDPGLHYNIQIHLPATKDVEVYNAIFKSLKEHLFE
jgi:hypothetical protein